MEYFDASHVQFLDLSGVEEQEKNWILTSLQTRDSTVKGPWRKASFRADHVIQRGCTTSNHIENYQQYPTTPNLILTNHVNTLPQTVYQYATTPIYQPPFVPSVHTVVNAVVPVVPVNPQIVASPLVPIINNQYTQHVTYPTYPVVQQTTMTNAYSQSVTIITQQPVPIVVNNCVMNNTDICNQVEIQEYESDEYIEADNNAVRINEATVSVDASVNNINNDCTIDKTIENIAKDESQNAANKSWASLFNKRTNGIGNNITGNEEECIPVAKVSPFVSNTVNNVENVHNNISPLPASRKADFDDPNYYRMGEFLTGHGVDHRITSLQPRGLINRSNYCYINSILQALMACPPLYNLLSGLADNVNLKTNEKRKHSQMIDNMAKFVKEFHYLPDTQRVHRRSDNKNPKKEQTVSINCESPFEPFWIYKMLNGIKSDSFVVEGRQEDAEEFLGCLLNGLNDEMLELMKLIDEESVKQKDIIDNEKQVDGAKEWVVMGPKNKSSVTRRADIIRTPISDIFGGHIRSRLLRAGDQITDNIQPFFTLQLNIEKVNTVREALEALVCKNQLEGVTSSKTNEEVEAWQQVTIEELPIVLVLHLKCFDFKLDGCTKILKALEFPVDLKVDAKLLSSKANYTPKEKKYKLFAVVYHDGKEATKGHYLTDAYHVGYTSWIRYDDSAVKAVQEENVLKPHGTRVPYLLFYRRCDTVRSK